MQTPNSFKAGFVALIGRTNAGKSTLLNALTQQKVSITTPKSQTTRNNIRGIVNLKGEAQIVFIDTPGIHLSAKRELNKAMIETARAALGDADLAVFLIDAPLALDKDGNIPKIEQMVFEDLEKTKAPCILAINKMDALAQKDLLLPIIDAYQKHYPFRAIQIGRAHV